MSQIDLIILSMTKTISCYSSNHNYTRIASASITYCPFNSFFIWCEVDVSTKYAVHHPINVHSTPVQLQDSIIPDICNPSCTHITNASILEDTSTDTSPSIIPLLLSRVRKHASLIAKPSDKSCRLSPYFNFISKV